MKFWLFYAFLLGTFVNIGITLGGFIPGSLLLASSAAPLLLSKHKFNQRVFIFLSSCCILWCLGILIGDVYNKVGYMNLLKGIAKPISVFVYGISFAMLITKVDNWVSYWTLGLLTGSLINAIFPNQVTQDLISQGDYEFRLYIYQPIIFGGLLFAISKFPKRHLLHLIIIISSIFLIGFFAPSRASLGILSLTAFFIILIGLYRKKNIKISKAKLIITFAAIFIAGYATYGAYIYSAPRGYLGEQQRRKFEDQTNTALGISPIGILAAGRTSTFGAVLAIKDNPIIGYGSWARMRTHDYYIDAMSYVAIDSNDLKVHAMPGVGHSVFLETWVESGVLGAVFCILVIVLVIKIIIKCCEKQYLHWPIWLYLCINYCWTWLFSPTTPKSLMFSAVFIVLAKMSKYQRTVLKE